MSSNSNKKRKLKNHGEDSVEGTGKCMKLDNEGDLQCHHDACRNVEDRIDRTDHIDASQGTKICGSGDENNLNAKLYQNPYKADNLEAQYEFDSKDDTSQKEETSGYYDNNEEETNGYYSNNEEETSGFYDDGEYSNGFYDNKEEESEDFFENGEDEGCGRLYNFFGEYYDDYEDEVFYGDGVNEATLDTIKSIIFDLIYNTRKEDGLVSHDAEQYLGTLLGLCTLEQRREIMLVSNNVHTPLSLACRFKNLPLVKFLVEHCEAGVNGGDEVLVGRPLLCAIVNGAEDIVHYLLECNADIGLNFSQQDNLNLLMVALRVFPEDEFDSFGYKHTTKISGNEMQFYSLGNETETLLKGRIPVTYGIVKSLIDNGALENCSEEQIFHILTHTLTENTDIDKKTMQYVLDHVSMDIGNVRNNEGLSVLGYEIIHKSHDMSGYLKPYMENVSNIDKANLLPYYRVPFYDNKDFALTFDKVEANVDEVLSLFVMDEETHVIAFEEPEHGEEENMEEYDYVHPVLYLAASGKASLYHWLLSRPNIPLKVKVDSLDVLGSFCCTCKFPAIAGRLWGASHDIRQAAKEGNSRKENANNLSKTESKTKDREKDGKTVFEGKKGNGTEVDKKITKIENGSSLTARDSNQAENNHCTDIRKAADDRMIDRTSPGSTKEILTDSNEIDHNTRNAEDYENKLGNEQMVENQARKEYDENQIENNETKQEISSNKEDSMELCNTVPVLTNADQEQAYEKEEETNDQGEKEEKEQINGKETEEGDTMYRIVRIPLTIPEGDHHWDIPSSVEKKANEESSDNLSYVTDAIMPQYGQIFGFERFSKYYDLISQRAIQLVVRSYNQLAREGNVPDISHSPFYPSFTIPQFIVMDQLPIPMTTCLPLNPVKREMEGEIALALKCAQVREQYIGYGDFRTLLAFKNYGKELEKVGRHLELATFIVYCFPYFIQYTPNGRWYNEKKNSLQWFILKMIGFIVNENLRAKLNFDLLMAVWKCLYLESCVTPMNQRKFLEFGPLLAMIKILYTRDKSVDECKRFSQFLRHVVKSDLRNLYGQTLLHHVVTTCSNEEMSYWMGFEEELRPLIDFYCGSVDLIKLLIAHGANVNAFDLEGMTPLRFSYHVMLGENEDTEEGRDSPQDIVQTLLTGGAHPDCIDHNGISSVEISENSVVPLCPVGNRTLQCLASIAIVNAQIEYCDQLPQHLKDFVELHCAHGESTNQNFPEQIFGAVDIARQLDDDIFGW